MKTLFKWQMVALIAFIATANVFTQEWTKEQLEVWQVVEDGWTKWQTGDIEGFAATTHEKYQGWNDQNPLPSTKEMVIQGTQRSIDIGNKVDYFVVNPARIVVTGNAAVVDYYYYVQRTIVQEEENEVVYQNGQNVEFYVKEGGKWLLLGDMTTINYAED